jgi:hypothetical protein
LEGGFAAVFAAVGAGAAFFAAGADLAVGCADFALALADLAAGLAVDFALRTGVAGAVEADFAMSFSSTEVLLGPGQAPTSCVKPKPGPDRSEGGYHSATSSR